MAKSVARNALYNGLRTISSMLFPLITYPYVTRVLLADNLGKVDFTASVISYFTLIAGLGITNYAIREGAGLRERRPAIDAFSSQVFSINLCSMTVSYLLLALLLLLWPQLGSYGLLVGIQSLTILGTTIGIDWVYAIHEEYGYITMRTIVVQAVSALLLFALVKEPSDYVTYAAITVFSSVGANVFNFFHARHHVTIRPTWRFDARRHLVPMLVLFGNSVAVTIYVSTDVTLLGIFRGDHDVGIYSVAVRVYSVVKQLLNSLVTVSVPRLSLYRANGRQDDFQRLLESVVSGLTLTVIPIVCMLFLMADYVVFVIGGAGFSASATPLRALCLAMVPAVFATCVANSVLLPSKGERFVLRSTTTGAVVNLSLNLLLIPSLGPVGAAATTFLAETVVLLVASWFARTFCDLRGLLARVTPSLLTSVLCVISMTSAFAVVNALVGFSVAGFFLSCVTFAIVYAVVLIVRRDEFVGGLLRSLSRRP